MEHKANKVSVSTKSNPPYVRIATNCPTAAAVVRLVLSDKLHNFDQDEGRSDPNSVYLNVDKGL